MEKKWKEQGADMVYIYSFRINDKHDFNPTIRETYSVTKFTIGDVGQHVPVEYTRKTIKFVDNIREAEKFIDSCKVKEVDWYDIISHINLTERFIRKYLKHFTWFDISTYQKLSESFAREWKDKLNWNAYVENPKNKFSKEFIYEMEKYTRKTSLKKYFDKNYSIDE